MAYYYGWVYSDQGENERRIADFDRPIELDPQDAYAYYYRARL